MIDFPNFTYRVSVSRYGTSEIKVILVIILWFRQRVLYHNSHHNLSRNLPSTKDSLPPSTKVSTYRTLVFYVLYKKGPSPVGP